MGLAREHDALELGIRQQPVRDDALRQEGTVCRHGMGHGRHGRGLHQRRRMLDGARNPDDARPPGRVGTGAVGGGIGRGLLHGAGLDREFGDLAPVTSLPRFRGRYWLRTPPLRGLRRHRLAEQVAGRAGSDRRRRNRHGLDRQPLRQLRDDGIEQFAGIAGAGFAVDCDARFGTALQHGQARVETGSAPCIGAAVDRRGEDAAGRRIEACEGVGPGGVARHAMG